MLLQVQHINHSRAFVQDGHVNCPRDGVKGTLDRCSFERLRWISGELEDGGASQAACWRSRRCVSESFHFPLSVLSTRGYLMRTQTPVLLSMLAVAIVAGSSRAHSQYAPIGNLPSTGLAAKNSSGRGNSNQNQPTNTWGNQKNSSQGTAVQKGWDTQKNSGQIQQNNSRNQTASNGWSSQKNNGGLQQSYQGTQSRGPSDLIRQPSNVDAGPRSTLLQSPNTPRPRSQNTSVQQQPKRPAAPPHRSH
jgi:hypothetical protein